MLISSLKYLTIAALVFTSVTCAHAQVTQFNGQNMNTPISQEEGRFLEFNNLVDIAYLKDSTQSFLADDMMDLTLDESVSYTYNPQGVEVSRIVKSVSNLKWTNKRKVENQYNFEQLVSEQDEFGWNPEFEIWEPTKIVKFNYNFLNQQIETIEMLSGDGGEWINSRKMTFSYLQDELIEEEMTYLWDLDNDKWVNDQKTVFSYNELNAIETEILQEWNDSLSTWVDVLIREFKYNSDNLLIASIRSFWQPGAGWVKASELNLEYNDIGQLEGTIRSNIENDIAIDDHTEIAKYSVEGYLGETIQSTLDEDSGEWEVTKVESHFWSEHYNGQLTTRNNEIDCQFVNPYLLGLPWYCENLKDDIQYTIEVFDMWGRSFYTDQLSNQSTFRLQGNIPPGLYNVVIQGGLDRHTEKVLIRN